MKESFWKIALHKVIEIKNANHYDENCKYQKMIATHAVWDFVSISKILYYESA